jgi:hypothetical protein
METAGADPEMAPVLIVWVARLAMECVSGCQCYQMDGSFELSAPWVSSIAMAMEDNESNQGNGFSIDVFGVSDPGKRTVRIDPGSHCIATEERC